APTSRWRSRAPRRSPRAPRAAAPAPAFRSARAPRAGIRVPAWFSCLHGVQPRIAAAAMNELGMRAALDQLTTLHDEDALRVAYRGEPVRDDDHRAPLGDEAHVVLDHALRFVVERRGRLTEDQDARIG